MTEPKTACEATMAKHVTDVLSVFQMFGIGLGCETLYQSMVEIAELARQLNGFETYAPQPDGIGSQLAGAYHMAEQMGQSPMNAINDMLEMSLSGESTPKAMVN